MIRWSTGEASCCSERSSVNQAPAGSIIIIHISHIPHIYLCCFQCKYSVKLRIFVDLFKGVSL